MASDITLNAGAGGAIIRTDPTTSSEHFQMVKLAYGDTGTFNFVSTSLPLPVVTSGPLNVLTSGPLQVLTSGTLVVTATQGTNPWSSAPGFNVPMVSASSGLIQISGTPTVVSASSGLVQVSGTVTVLSASSGLVQISGTPLVNIVGTSGATSPATSSGGLGVTILGGAAAGSTAINIVGTSGATAPATSSGGLGVTILGGAAAGSTVVNLSSTPFFNVVGTSSGVAPATTSGGLLVTAIQSANYNVVSASSGLVQVSGTVTVLSASSGVVQTLTTGAMVLSSAGLVQAIPITPVGTAIATSSSVVGLSVYHNITPTSSVAGAGIAPVTSSAGLLASLSSGTVGLTSGTVTLSSNHTFVSASSGLVQLTSAIGISSGTVTLSSAMALSSGIVTFSSTPFFNLVGTSSGVAVVTTSGGLFVTALPSSNWSVNLTSGTVTLSSNPTVVNASSGVVQVLTSGPLIVSQSSGLVTFSSTPLVQSASSGNVGIVGMTSSGQSMYLFFTTGAVTVQNVTTAASNLKSYMFFNSSVAGFSVKLYNTTGPTAGSTSGQVLSILVPGSTGGGGANFSFQSPGPYSSNGWSIIPTLSPGATSTDIPSTNHALNLTYQV